MTLPIVTERLILRQFAESDAHDLLECVSHPSVAGAAPEIEARPPITMPTRNEIDTKMLKLSGATNWIVMAPSAPATPRLPDPPPRRALWPVRLPVTKAEVVAKSRFAYLLPRYETIFAQDSLTLRTSYKVGEITSLGLVRAVSHHPQSLVNGRVQVFRDKSPMPIRGNAKG